MSEKKTKTKPFITPAGRVSFPSLDEPNEYGGKKKFQVVLIWPEGTDLSGLEAAIEAAADEKWGKGKWPKNTRLPIKDCADKAEVDGYGDGGRYMNFWSKRRPKLVGSERDESGQLVEVDADQIFPGCWARVSCNLFACSNQEFKTNDVIGGLLNVQFVKEDESFGGFNSDPDEDFESPAF
jgi:hypothetical protein